MQLITLILLAVIVEGVVEWAKTLYTSGKFSWPTLIALIVGITVCVTAGADLFALVGVPLNVPYLGAALTGILISRGSNYIHDFVGKIGGENSV